MNTALILILVFISLVSAAKQPPAPPKPPQPFSVTFEDPNKNYIEIKDDSDPVYVEFALINKPQKDVILSFTSDSNNKVQFSECTLVFTPDEFDIGQGVVIESIPIYNVKLTNTNIDTKIFVKVKFTDTNKEYTYEVKAKRIISVARSCSYTGDPHLTTFDTNGLNGVTVDNQNNGYYWLINHPTLKIQVLQYLCRGKAVYCVMSIAIQYDEDVVIIAPDNYYQKKDKPYLYKTNNEYNFLNVVQRTPTSPNGCFQFDVTLDSFILATVQACQPQTLEFKKGYMNIQVFLPSRYRGEISGLCGNYNGFLAIQEEFPRNSKKKVDFTQYLVPDCQNIFAFKSTIAFTASENFRSMFADKQCTAKGAVDLDGFCCSAPPNKNFCGTSALNNQKLYLMSCGDLSTFQTTHSPLDVSSCPPQSSQVGYLDENGKYVYAPILMKRDGEGPPVNPIATAPAPAEEIPLDQNIVVNNNGFAQEFNQSQEVHDALKKACAISIEDANLCKALLGDKFLENLLSECQADSLGHFNAETGDHDEQPNEKFLLAIQSCHVAAKHLEDNKKAADNIEVTDQVFEATVKMEEAVAANPPPADAPPAIPGDLPVVQNQDVVVNNTLSKRDSLKFSSYVDLLSKHFGFGAHPCPKGCHKKEHKGNCTPSGCVCKKGWRGYDCGTPTKFKGDATCPNKCHASKGQGYCDKDSGCICTRGWRGWDCGTPGDKVKPKKPKHKKPKKKSKTSGQ